MASALWLFVILNDPPHPYTYELAKKVGAVVSILVCLTHGLARLPDVGCNHNATLCWVCVLGH